MQPMVVHAVAVLVAFSATCRAGQAGEPEYFVENMRCLGEPFGLSLPPSLPELMAMAPVLSEQVQQVEQWEGYTSTAKTVRFKGLTLGLITFSNDPKRYSLSSAQVLSPAWARLSHFKVGQIAAAVHAVFGSVGEDDTDLRSKYSGENEGVRFETREGHVTRVIYECYTG